MPNWPRSTECVAAVEQSCHPVHLMAAASSTGALKIGYPASGPAPIGVSTWQMARAALLMMGRIWANIGRKS